MFVSEIKGHRILVMAPTGSGKGTLAQHLREKFPQITHTVSCTTRAQRPQEEHNVHYCFLTRNEFETKIANREFVEWAEYGGNLYGTLKSDLDERLMRGEVVLCEIEVQGVLQLLRYIPEQHRTVIYIDGGDWDVLKKRACERAPLTEAELELRHERYLEEMAHKGLADVVVHNQEGKLEEAKTHIEVIVDNVIRNKLGA